MTFDYSETVPYLLHWYERNARILRWREEPKPYYVWVSEIMLQQTRVEAVKGYFDRFIAELPDIQALAEAEEEKLLKLWEGLGYYNRVRNMQKAAQIVVDEYGGELPADYEALKKLPGIGSYTAGAIASIAFGIPEPSVDGNVLRVLKRVAASFDDITKEKVKKELEADVRRIMPKNRPGDFNQSLMELGATVCLPNGKPLCEQCPVMHLCKAFHAGCEMQIPVKTPKKERKIEERTVFILKQECEKALKIVLHKRPDKGLLSGMWELPNEEGHLKEAKVQTLFPEAEITRLPDGKHIFSHVEWRMWCYEIKWRGKSGLPQTMPSDVKAFTPQEIKEQISIPSAFDCCKKYIDNIE
ncbi:MAG: A/G-specific adenine glycosylase [Lachnospiraceae bacterium]|nr:A/G-specific adenine glycosylase [Lachnospiraceae bacterium]